VQITRTKLSDLIKKHKKLRTKSLALKRISTHLGDDESFVREREILEEIFDETIKEIHSLEQVIKKALDKEVEI